MIRNIVFDMGGVLLDGTHMMTCMRYAKDHQKARTLAEAIFEHPSWGPIVDGGVMNESEYLVEVQKRLPTDELKQMATGVLSDWWLDTLWPMKGMGVLIEELLDKGYHLYVLSNISTAFYKFQYKIPHIERFDGVLVSAEEHLIKPDPAIYHRLFEKFGLKAEECFFVDDRQVNIDSALSVGMQGHCFADGDVNRLRDHLNQL